MARAKHNNKNGYYTTIATKISQGDKAKLITIAEGFSMTFYELLQGLLLALVRYFDADSIVTAEHNIMMNAFANNLFSLKDSYSPLAIRDYKNQNITKAILFVERNHKQPQLLSVSKDSSGVLKESYNIETMLKDIIGSIDPDALQALCQMKANNGYFSLTQTLHELILSRKPDPADTMREEIMAEFEDLRIATGEKPNEDVHYKTARTHWESCTAPAMPKKPVRTSYLKL